MAATILCGTTCCDEPLPVQVPGVEGDPGTNGVNAYTYNAEPGTFTLPAADAIVTTGTGSGGSVLVTNSSWMSTGQIIVFEGPAHFEVVSTPSAGSVALEFKAYRGDLASGATIAAGVKVSPSGTQPALAAALPVKFAANDLSGGTASDAIAVGVGINTLAIPITLAQITGAADVLTDYLLGYKFKILSVDARVTSAVTTAAKLLTLNLEIGSTNLTGGAVALTSANCTPLGAAIAGTAVTAANTGAANATISIEASSVTAFVEGAIVLLIRIQNMDTADALASLAAHSDDLVDSLTFP